MWRLSSVYLIPWLPHHHGWLHDWLSCWNVQYACLQSPSPKRSRNNRKNQSSSPESLQRMPVEHPQNTALSLGIEPAFVPSELLAMQLLQRPHISHSDVLGLWTLIPNCKRLKPPTYQLPGQSYTVFGLSPRMPKTATVPSFPLRHTARALSAFVASYFPNHKFTTISLATNSNEGPPQRLQQR